MRSTLVETLIGGVVLVVAGFFLVFAFKAAGLSTSQGYELVAKFNRADGVGPGTDVRMSGIKIGSVDSVALDPLTFDAVVSLRIDTQYDAIPDDTMAKISLSGLLGDNFVSLEPGGSLENLKPGDEFIQTQGSVDLLGLISQAIFSTKTE